MAELRATVDAFVDLYNNEQWLPDKNGFRPAAMREEAWFAQKVAAQGRFVSRDPGAVQQVGPGVSCLRPSRIYLGGPNAAFAV